MVNRSLMEHKGAKADSIYAYFLRVRLIIVARLFEDLGIWRTLLLILVAASLMIDYRIAFVSALIFPLFWQLQRKDREFIRHLNLSESKIFRIEYFFISSPFMLCLLLTGHFLFLVLLVIYAFVVPWLPVLSLSPKRLFHSLPLISPSLFEWRRGFRKTYGIFIILYLAGIIFSKNEYVIPSIVFLLSLLIAATYDTCEPVFYLITEQRSPVRFLYYKSGKAVLFFLMLVSPLSVIYLAFHFKLMVWLLLAYGGGAFMIIEAILLKYALYVENKQISYHQGYIIMISSISLFYAPPLSLVLAVWLYFKSIKKLKWYLNA